MEIVLQPLSVSEFPIIMDAVNAQDRDFMYLWAGSTYTYPLTIEQMEQHYGKGVHSIEAGVFLYKIVDRETQRMIGSVQIGRIDPIRKEAVVGRFLIHSEHHRGQGIGEKVLRGLARIGFEELDLERILLNVYHINARAIRCYEKVGFCKTYSKKKLYQALNGEYWDGIEMTLEKQAWMAAK
ncbi:GNAT family N-acetyltransferase [Paenibacillus harenae]|uniref:RimJ/RimL family protein N-acetyltransferase n=1 Tax=Paenibacillus harenae TaxID=306543 RepID=A0ABT9TYC2_PAEHA|nr:GNAT family protein [Paenibacillus harenae]MDQ0060085.1 RimJ/RimL family protein N-acetyltransferase [Paenibacillus harenae]MDQ0112365.1 RimJ/RimL family protein N-acetyltransferase [Paenibacillus harenae]